MYLEMFKLRCLSEVGTEDAHVGWNTYPVAIADICVGAPTRLLFGDLTKTKFVGLGSRA